MKKIISQAGLSTLLILVAIGCAKTETAQDDKKLREAFSGKTFDPNKMPPEARAIVEGMKKSGGNAAVKK
jgi:hypothetical protein